MFKGAHSLPRGPAFRAGCRRSYTRRTPQRASPEISKLLAEYAAAPAQPLTLSGLLSYAHPLSPESVLASVSYVQQEVPRRLAARIKALEALPYIVGTNPFVARTLQAYRQSFYRVATHPSVRTLDENEPFTALLESLVDGHANDIPTMAKGFQECTRYMSPTAISDYMDGAIRNRIDVRLLAEQHIAISRALKGQRDDGYIGVVHTRCSPAKMIRMCESFVAELCEATLGASPPPIILDGHADATFSYIPVHLEYMMTELLKNSFRASVEHHHKTYGTSSAQPIPPITITISPPPVAAGPPFLSMRIRDQGGGVPAPNMARIFSYAFSTAGRNAAHGEEGDGREEIGGGPYAAQHIGGSASVDSGSPGEGSLFAEIAGKGLQTGMGTIAGLGYGLPMSKLYAKYFGGTLELLSLEGWGSDVFMKLRCLDAAGDVEI